MAQWTPAGVVAAIGCAGCVASFVVATKWTTAANAILLQYSGIVWVLLLSPFVLHEPLRRRDLIATPIALGGVALLVGGDVARDRLAGDALAVFSGICCAAMRLALRLDPASGEAAVTGGNALAAIALLPAAGLHPLDGRTTALVVFLGVVQVAGGYALFVRGVSRIAAAPAALVSMLEAVANPLWVYLVLGERPRGAALLGAAVVLGAIAWRTVDIDQTSRARD